MRHLPLLATLLLLPGAIGTPLPSYWEGDGMAHWMLFTPAPTNHGGSNGVAAECDGTVQLASWGPAIRRAEAGPIGVIVGEREEHGKYDVAIELVPHATSECGATSFRFWSTYDPQDLLDETLDCELDVCTRVTLTWSEEGAGALRILREGAFDIDASVGTTFATPT